MEIVVSIVAKISEYAIEPIIRQFGYLVFYRNNVKGLDDELQKLVGAKSRVQQKIDEAENQGEIIEDDVQKWLTKVDAIMVDAHNLLSKIEDETKKTCSNGSCFNLRQRHQLSRKTKKLTSELANNIQEGKFDKVGYPNYVKGLENQLQKLVDAERKVQQKIDEAKNQAEDIKDDVKTWLTTVDEIMEKARDLLKKIEDEKKKTCSNDSCFSLPQGHQLSKKTMKLTSELAKIEEQGKFDNVGYCRTLSEIKNNSGYQPFKSRMKIMEGIVEALKDNNINMIGVHGMGGTGKTTLVKEISSQVWKSKLFEQVIMATVGQNPNIKDIQGQLADMMDLSFGQETEQGRAAKLRKRLQMEKKILIIFDDIWNGLDLGKVGIPSRDEHKGCKILITSRSKQVLLSKMGVEKKFKVKDLMKEESWKFFKDMVEEKSLETNLEMKQVAIQIVDRCGRLPIALATVVKVLKKEPFYRWKDALRQLRDPVTVDIGGVSKDVYACLKLSYDYLNSQEAKLLFLLCSMFSDDYDISKDDLSRYVLGMRLVQGSETLGTTRDRTLTLIDDLESSSLLQTSESRKEYVRMHDVVRDVSIYISSTHDRICTLSYGKGLSYWGEEKTQGDNTAIFVDRHDLKDLPKNMSFPKLELLAVLVGGNKYKIEYLEIPEGFFEGMKMLKVLHLEKMYISSTPSPLHYLASLRILLLIDCQLGNIDMIGELQNLEVLDFSRSDIIELPLSISQLSRLKQLSASNCERLKVIPPLVISRLGKLEELLLDKSFKRWVEKGLNNCEIGKNASVLELDHLPLLTRLKVCTPIVEYLPKGAFSKNQKLECFEILIGKDNMYDVYSAERVLDIVMMDSRNIVLEEGVKILMKQCEELRLAATFGAKDVLLELNRSTVDSCSHLRQLTLKDSEDIEYLMSEFDPKLSCKPFTILESLDLLDMKRLDTITQGFIKTITVFENLKTIRVRRCHKLKYLFPFYVMKGLSNLKNIQVGNCEMMEAIVVMENEDQKTVVTDKMEWKQLRRLMLFGLPRLKSICCIWKSKGLIQSQSSEIIEEEDEKQLISNYSITPFLGQVAFPNLDSLTIEKVNNIWDDQLLANYNFINLKTIQFWNCENIKSIFTYNSITMLKELQTLRVMNCNALEEVFTMNQIMSNEEDGVVISFPSLTSVHFLDCPNMKKLFQASLTKHLHQLSLIEILDCENISEIFGGDELETMECSKVSFPELNYLNISGANNLAVIWHNQLIVEDMSTLQTVTLCHCRKLKSVFTSNVMRAIKNLQYLEITNCDSLEEVFEVTGEEEEIATINLKSLRIRNLPNMKRVWSKDPDGVYFFPNINHVKVIGCPNLKSLFPLSIAMQLPHQLERLYTDEDGVDAIFMNKEGFIFGKDSFIRCKKMELSWNWKKVIREPCHLKLSRELFPALKVLKFDGSSNYKLTVFPDSLDDQLLFSVEELQVSDIFLVEIFSNERLITDEENQSGTYSAPLKKLQLYKLPNLIHIWKESSHRILQSFDNLKVVHVKKCGRLNVLVPSASFSFQNMKELKIQECHGLISLLHPSVAKTLVHLKEMELSECKRMITVIVERQDEQEDDEIVFTRLEALKLYDLPILSGFQSTRCTIEFPRLKSLTIKKCPEMKMFSRGIICTPLLKCVSVDVGKYLYQKLFKKLWEGDINATIQRLWEDDDYNIQNLFNEEFGETP